jgi:hypothetical protein
MVRKGERYRTLRDLEVGVLTHYRAPFTGGGRAILPAGEIFTVAIDPPAHAVAASCDPQRYEALHEKLVSEEDRGGHNYSGYSLVVEFDSIERDCEMVS